VKTKFDINVVSIDAAKKLNIIKEIKNLLGLGLKESKELVEKGNFQFKQGVEKAEAEQIKENLEKIGCKVELA
jgi:large subunit ribosomal protein L7/L12